MISERFKKKIKNKKFDSIYLSYDGILDNVGFSQIYNYLVNIKINYNINLISFEKKEKLNNSKDINNFNKNLYYNNIIWNIKKYYNTPKNLSTIINFLIGFFVCFKLLIFKKIKVIHIRGLPSGIMIFPLMYFFTFKIIFDMRGFWAEEKADRANLKRNSISYKLLLFIEKKLLFNSEYIICLTNESTSYLKKKYDFLKNKNFVKIPTCVDMKRFKIKNQINKKKIIFSYLGSIDTAYDIDPVLNFLDKISKRNVSYKIYFFSKKTKKLINKLKNFNISKENYSIKELNYHQVPKYLTKTDIGIFYLKKNLSIKASFPTKIAEFLACGIPIICNDFNKDITNMIIKNKLGIIMNFNNENITPTLNQIKIKYINSKKSFTCRQYANNFLSLNSGILKLESIYDKL